MKNVVIIDDNKIDCFVNRKIITRAFENIITKTFTSGVDALEYFKNPQGTDEAIQLFNPDLILLDINMPVMNGFEFLNELGKTTAYKDNPIDVYFLSSSNNEKDISNALEIEYCSGYIVKPLTQSKLNRAIDLKNQRANDLRYMQSERR